MRHRYPSIHPVSITALSLLWGFLLTLGEGRELPGQVASSSLGPHWWQRPLCKVPTAHQYLAQGHFDMQLSSGIGTSDLPITSRPALPAEPQPLWHSFTIGCEKLVRSWNQSEISRRHKQTVYVCHPTRWDCQFTRCRKCYRKQTT